MKLYDCAMAPNPRRELEDILSRKKLKIDIEQVNILEGENLSNAVNRWGFVPTLELDNGTYCSNTMHFSMLSTFIPNQIYLVLILLKWPKSENGKDFLKCKADRLSASSLETRQNH